MLIADRPPNRFTTLSEKKKEKRRKKWQVTCDMWHVTCDTWHGTHDMWHMIYERRGRWTFSKDLRFLALTVLEWRCFEDISPKGWLTESVRILKIFYRRREVIKYDLRLTVDQMLRSCQILSNTCLRRRRKKLITIIQPSLPIHN